MSPGANRPLTSKLGVSLISQAHYYCERVPVNHVNLRKNFENAFSLHSSIFVYIDFIHFSMSFVAVGFVLLAQSGKSAYTAEPLSVQALATCGLCPVFYFPAFYLHFLELRIYGVSRWHAYPKRIVLLICSLPHSI